jgi:hypothetical protein
MNRVIRIILTSCLIVLVGCGEIQPYLSANINSFSTITPTTIKGPVYVIANPPEAQETLEFKSYKGKLEQRLATNGFPATSDPDKAKFIAHFYYAIDDGQTVTSTYSVPIFGQTGGGTSMHSGTVYSSGGIGSFSGTTYSAPTFGVVGSSTGTSVGTVYNRIVRLDIYQLENGRQGEKVFESKAVSTGSCGALSEVIDEILDATFQNFPDTNGVVDVNSQANC